MKSLVLLMLAASLTFAQTPLLLQKPTLSKTQIVFSFANDLWAVDRTGGDARRLTSNPGVETDPVFSPDGTMIAFTGQYDGNTDVYVMPASGGIPKRLTWFPGLDAVCGWSPDGRSILFRSSRASTNGTSRLYTVAVEGGAATEIPLYQAEWGTFSPDAKRIAYLPLASATQTWKWYRGGRTSKIWIADLADSKVTEIPRENSNDFSPAWIGNKIYFLSDRSGPVGIYAYDLGSKKVTPVVKGEGTDIKAASAGPGAIVYEKLGGIHLLDLNSGKASQVNIKVEGDFPDIRTRYEKVNTQINAAAISPTGVRALFGAHGEILTVPAEKGDVRNLTQTTDVHERNPAWSPDGKWIAYFSDESGEYALHLKDQRGTGETKKISLPPAFYYSPEWSPDSKKIAFTDQLLNRWYLEIEKGQPVKIDTELYLDGRGLPVAWSPDSRWIVYPRALDNHFRAIFVYNLESGKATQITDGMGDARVARFDAGGKYIYFTASTDVGPQLGDGLATFQRSATRNVYLVTLKKDTPSPLSAESDEEKSTDPAKPDPAKPDATKPDAVKPDPAKPEAAKPAKPKTPNVEIDFDGIMQRVVTVPIPARNYTGLLGGKENVFYLTEAAPPAPGAPGAPGQTLLKYDLKSRKLDRIIDGIGAVDISANGEKMLYSRGFGPGQQWFIAGAAAPPPPTTQPLKLDQMEIRVDPKAEWKHMFREVWRNQRDFFYDSGVHGLDLKEAARQYEPFLDGLASRNDLNYLFMEMLGEIDASHIFVGGGSQSQEIKNVPGGLLGCDYKIENGRYRFAKIFNGENWNPQARAPLTEPGVDVKVGDYLIAVNGRDVTAPAEVYQFFEATSGKQTTIKVSADPSGANAREYTVVPIPNERQLRYLDWIEGNRRKVELATNGQVGYIHMPDTAFGGYTNFNRYLFAQAGKPGMIVDERYNGGGALADYVIEHLKRPLMNYITFRAGKDVTLPYGVVPGPKVMIVNEYAGSGGDAMPYYFKKSQLGPLVGKRTWGGLIRADGAPQLLDGGFHSAPGAGIWAPNGEWVGENVGIGPDIEIEQDPAAVRAGKDPQLEKAIEYAMAQLKKNPPEMHKRPPYSRYKKGQKAPATTGGN